MIAKIYTLEDLLAQTHTPLSQIGMDSINASIQAHLEYLNNAVSEQMAIFAEESTDVRRLWGGTEQMTMTEGDEFSEGRTQAPTNGVEVAFPLRKYDVATGWSKEWFNRAMAAELAKSVLNAQAAYKTAIQGELMASIFKKDNYTFKNFLGDNLDLAIKAFLNADGAAVPSNPNGKSFLGTHQHYVGTVGAALAVADVDNLLANVIEHGGMKGITLFVSASMVATLAALASTKFVKLTSSVINPADTSVSTIIRDNVEADPDNKLVGYWDSYPVVTRSWCPANYIACVATGATMGKPLVMRVDPAQSMRGLLAVAEWEQPVIAAKRWKAYFGFGAYNRAAVAVLDTGHQTTYSNPTGLVR